MWTQDADRGMWEGDPQGQVRHENNHKNPSCFALGISDPLSDCHTPKEKALLYISRLLGSLGLFTDGLWNNGINGKTSVRSKLTVH